ncbi:stage II sporulation protein P [Dendrosporobacter sp. 1207_IL3150]|uniref:stage II sporulation protein P n=1 Tax=Dendrosporobacter sp. 1207_IL3150 TaxID=3084054 RepID=UPI002FD97135
MTRRQRRQQSDKKILFVCVAIVMICSLIFWSYLEWSEETLAVSNSGHNTFITEKSSLLPKWRDILFSGVPGLASTAEAQPMVKVKPEITLQNILHGAVLFFTDIDIRDWRTILKAEMPIMAVIKTSPPSVSAISLPNFPKFDPQNILPKGKPIVGVYHTHTAESFIPSSGVAHKPGGQIGEIVNVGGALVKKLETLGIPSVQNKTIHDYPSFMKAYGASELTVQKMLAENPSLQIVLDIHRDADKRENSTAIVNGVPAAKITIVVATGQQDLPQPHWQQNHAFAKLIDAKLNQYYPGLSKGILLVEWRYNQHLHPRALLIEVGCQENSREEAERSIEFLGDVIAQIIAESN